MDAWAASELKRDKERISKLEAIVRELKMKPRDQWTQQDKIDESAYFFHKADYDRKTHPIYGSREYR